MGKDTFQILASSVFLLQIVTNLKSRNSNKADAPEVLCCPVFTLVQFNFILRVLFTGISRR
jgi:hypothetical protein